MTPKGHAIPSKTQLLSYGTPAFSAGVFSDHRSLFMEASKADLAACKNIFTVAEGVLECSRPKCSERFYTKRTGRI